MTTEVFTDEEFKGVLKRSSKFNKEKLREGLKKGTQYPTMVGIIEAIIKSLYFTDSQKVTQITDLFKIEYKLKVK